jgi:photosystem II stability/assembly factor-like uncharacterized protein
MKAIVAALLHLIVSFPSFSQNWEPVQGIPSTYIWSVVDHDGILFANTDSAIYRSTDGGNSWFPSLVDLEGGKAITVLFSTHHTLFAGTAGDGVYKSNDLGTTWQRAGNELEGWSADVIAFASLGDSLYAGTNGAGIYVLGFSDTATWSAFNQGLPQYQTEAIAASGNTLIAAMSTDVFLRRQGDPSWSYVQLDTTVWQRRALKFIAAGEHLFAGTSVGIFRSDRDGQQWRKLSIPTFPNLPVETFAQHGTRIYAGVHYHNELFIITSDDWGTTWTPRSHEFAVLFDLLASGERLWAARTDGLWWYPLDSWTSVKWNDPGTPSTMYLHQNYPNPFNPTTNIVYDVPEQSRVTLTVLDLLGREVDVVVNQTQSAGRYKAVFDASALTSGVYFYRLTAGSYVKTNKMVLLR